MISVRSLLLVLSFVGLTALGGPEETALHRYEQLSGKSPETLSALSAAERESVFDAVSRHPVTDLLNLDKYDPDGFIGFCFGRSLGVHLMGRKLGLSAASVRKLFIIGDLRSGTDPEWRFHVTTLVKGSETQKWYAIDPIMTAPIAPGTALLLEDWVRIVRSVWDKNGQAKLYFTSPDTIMPDATKDPAGTTGDAIIELGFKPETKEGFLPAKFGTIEAWETNAKSEATYFISVNETETDRFKFDGLTIGTQFVDYRGYFLELLGDLTGEEPIPQFSPKTKAIQRLNAAAAQRGPANLRSPRFDRFFPQQQVTP